MDIKDIKKEFLTYRNGIVADTLRMGGVPHRYIFGLQLPQLREIATRAGHDDELGKTLWNDRECRESRILACFVLDPGKITEESAMEMIRDTRTTEEMDLLAFGLLRHLPFLSSLHDLLSDDQARRAVLARFLN